MVAVAVPADPLPPPAPPPAPPLAPPPAPSQAKRTTEITRTKDETTGATKTSVGTASGSALAVNEKRCRQQGVECEKPIAQVSGSWRLVRGERWEEVSVGSEGRYANSRLMRGGCSGRGHPFSSLPSPLRHPGSDLRHPRHRNVRPTGQRQRCCPGQPPLSHLGGCGCPPASLHHAPAWPPLTDPTSPPTLKPTPPSSLPRLADPHRCHRLCAQHPHRHSCRRHCQRRQRAAGGSPKRVLLCCPSQLLCPAHLRSLGGCRRGAQPGGRGRRAWVE